MMLNHVFFTPGSRTFWHTHERGQILEVKMGSGWVCDRGGVPRKIGVGDIVVCDAGTEHWYVILLNLCQCSSCTSTDLC